MEKQKYEYRIIAFIDILGFKNIIESKFCDEILRLLITFQDEVKKKSYFEEYVDNKMITDGLSPEIKNKTIKLQDRQVSLFSDLVVISYSNDRSNLNQSILELYSQILNLHNKLLPLNVLLRGGITYSKLLHDNTICFGEGLIKAYELESKKSKYPRIIIDPKILTNKTLKNIFDIKFPQIEEFDDGNYGFSYFNSCKKLISRIETDTEILNPKNPYYKMNGDISTKFGIYCELTSIKKLVDTCVENFYRHIRADNINDREKLDWLMNEYDKILTRLIVATEDNEFYRKLYLNLELRK